MARGQQWAEGSQDGDWVVAEAWQRQGIGSHFFEVVVSHAWQAKVLKLAWPSNQAREFAVQHARAAEILGPVPKAVLILNARKYLAEHRWPALMCAIAGKAIDTALMALFSLTLRQRIAQKIESVRRFDSSFDETTRRCMTWPGFWSPHNADFLNWRYFEEPSSEYAAFALVNGSNVEGYYVLKIEGPASWLMEFVAPVSPSRAASALLSHLIQTARAAGCTRIRFSAPPAWRHWRHLYSAGFLPVRSDTYQWPWLIREEPERGHLTAWQWVPGDMFL